MKKCFVIFLLPLSINAFSQITYDSGYFVKESGEKINCLIRNKRWLDNPSDFNYKIETSGGDVLTETVDGVKEFGVGNMKYVKATVKIDTSNQQNSKLSYNRVPEWKEEPVFLKVLVEGKGTLYEYKDTNVDVFLFSVNGSPIEQLVYKVFLQRDTRFGGNNIYYSKNETYLNQLNASVTCGNRPEANGKNLPYVKSLLEKYFMN